MAIRINTNVAAMNALRNTDASQTEFNKSITRLSTGLRIANASDDPAGLIISEKLRAQIAGVDQAVRNSQSGVNVLKTAEGALDEVNKLLKDARQLAVQASNTGVEDGASLQAIQNQLTSILGSVNRISSTTAFGQKKLLNGTSGVSVGLSTPSWVDAISFGSTVGGVSVTNGTVSMTQVTAAAQAALSGTTQAAKYTAAGTSLVTASSVVLNGVTITTDGTETVNQYLNKINSYQAQTGVTASFVDASDRIDLTQVTYGAKFKVTLQDNTGVIKSGYTSITGTNARYSVSVQYTDDAGTLTTKAGITFDGGRSAGESGLHLTDTYGNVVNLTSIGNSLTTEAAVGVSASGALNFQVGSEAGQTAKVSLGNVSSSQLGKGVVTGKSLSDIDVTTATGASDGLKLIDQAITDVVTMRGDIGSFHRNVLESNIRSLSVAKENLAATESGIRDVDMAEEITQFTKQQILQQSGLALLAQANSAPQSVLSLLRG